MSYAKTVYSPSGTFAQYASFKIGKGDWEITTLSVVMGSTAPALNGVEIGEGKVGFEILGPDDVVEEIYHLVSGRCTRALPMVMDSPKRVRGPGRIRSAMIHMNGSIAHTLSVTYRRVRE